MKKMLTVFLALMLVCVVSITAFADAPVETLHGNPMTTSQAAPSTADPVPHMVDGASESTEGSSAPGTLEQEQPDAVQEESPPAPEKPKSSNTPYFVGAIIAVIVFISVAMYCKFNGNGNAIV